MKSRPLKILARLAIDLLVLAGAGTAIALLTGCASPAYYWQAASGHLSLMHARQSVGEAIAAESDPDIVAKLELSRDIKAFAVDELALPDNDSYEAFVRTGRDAVVWNVVAAPEFSLDAKQWCFPVAGCVPYRGYFDENDADGFAAGLEARGMDVAISPAIAYSTLGWFDDPLLDTMLRQSEAQLAAYLFHELAHQSIYVKDDATFNESYASFVETVGVERWLRSRGEDEALARWQRVSAARTAFNALLEETREALLTLYQGDDPPQAMRAAKQAELDRLEERYDALRNAQWQGHDYFGGWFDRPPNNARFALLDTYEGGTCAFAALLEEAGGDMRRFHELAEKRARMPAEKRSAWLEQDCPQPNIAPAREL